MSSSLNSLYFLFSYCFFLSFVFLIIIIFCSGSLLMPMFSLMNKRQRQRQQQSLNNNKTIKSIHNTKQKQTARQAHEPWIGCASCIPHQNELTNSHYIRMCMQFDISIIDITFEYMLFFLSNNVLM